MMVVAVILITVVFEVVTHALDHYAEHVPHIFQIVQRVYKELMLLGIHPVTRDVAFHVDLLEPSPVPWVKVAVGVAVQQRVTVQLPLIVFARIRFLSRRSCATVS